MKQILKNRVNVVLIIGIIALYFTFLSLDIFSIPRSMESRHFKYASIVLCFLLATSLSSTTADKRDSGYVVLALVFTLLADIFLLFTNHKIIGIYFFCLMQLTYLKRYNLRFFIAGIIFAVVAIYVRFFLPFEPLYVIAGLYAILIGSCFFATFRTKLPRFNLYCVRIGMAFFIMCDINVAMYNQLSAGSNFYQIVTVAMWLFYLPAQFLLAMSASHPKVDNLLTKT